jgi:hypothetical protein
MKHEPLHFLKTNALNFTYTSEFLHMSYAPSVKILMFQRCWKFVMTVECAKRENTHILKKIRYTNLQP